MANKGVEGVVSLSGRPIERTTTRGGSARRVGWYAVPSVPPTERVRAEAGPGGSPKFWACGAAWAVPSRTGW